MYLINTEITCRWILEPTDTPLAAGDYDIRLIPNDLNGTYTDGGVVNFVAPAEGYGGVLEYVFTPLTPGKFKIYLSTGTAATYTIINEKTLWVFEFATVSIPSTIILGAGDIVPGNSQLTSGQTPGEYSLHSIATDGTIIVATAYTQKGVNLWGTFHTSVQFEGWEFHAFPFGSVDNPKAPHLAYGNGVWVATTYYGREAWYSTDAINWTAATVPTGDPLRTAQFLAYLPLKDVFYMGRGHGWYSDDGGVIWQKRGDLQTFPEVNYYDSLSAPLPGYSDYTLIGMGQERMLYTNNVTQNMGVFTLFYDPALWFNFPAFEYMDTDGTKIVVMSSAWDVASSTDIATWTATTLTGDTRTLSVLWMGYLRSTGKWYAITQDGTDPVYESDDAVNWTITHASPFEGYIDPPFHRPDARLTRGELVNDGWAMITSLNLSYINYQV